MREIKFRAWDKQMNVMIYQPSLKPSKEVSEIFLNGWFADNSLFVLMQYTSLKDKNGKEIYEGDIIADDHFGRSDKTYGTVIWKGSGFWVDEHKLGINGDLEGWQTERIEVIGNIHENPELIKKEDKNGTG